ncbi:FGGY family carbohydrate kinase [Pediococcus inopinatus]|uniref:FGGY-family carbohydrate kinase n=1 Tax=Pediococcus inopinatus TaxID=114090 RepID=UPI002B2634EA|nr:FGGY family carbohydrate kinase [Pediococcus inopinatus]WPC18286.1 FGGY family carbohydrate kinase [Pediococcus inopinatus]
MATQPIEQYKFKTPKIKKGECVDFDAGKLLEGIFHAIRNFNILYREKVQIISIASVGESGVLIDQFGKKITPMAAWFDNRSQYVIDSLSEKDRQAICRITGLPPHSHYSASKIKWLVDNVVDSSKKYTWLCIPDFITYKLTQKIGTEFSIASRTQVLDLTKREWSEKVKRIFKIENVDFPKIYNSGEIIGQLTPEVAVILGLSREVFVTIAGHDHMVGSFSSEQKSDELLDSTGTTEGILLLSKVLNKDIAGEKKGIAYGIYVNPEWYTTFTALPSVGSVIQWFSEEHKLTNKEFMKLLKEVYTDYLHGKIKKDQVNFVIPHFSGSGSPVKSNKTKGLWYGLTNQTTIKQLVFGLFLGLTFELKHAIETLTNDRVSTIKLIGPATGDPLWIQLRADLLNTRVIALNTPEAVSRGANIIANSTNYYRTESNIPEEVYEPQENVDLVPYLLSVYENEYKPLFEAKVNFEL